MGLIVTPGGVTMLATMAGLLARLGGEAPGATARGRLRACCGTIAGETTFLPPAPAADPAGTQQVWSVTQFYSVDFSQSRISVKSAFSTNAQSRFASVVVDGVLGPPHQAQNT